MSKKIVTLTKSTEEEAVEKLAPLVSAKQSAVAEYNRVVAIKVEDVERQISEANAELREVVEKTVDRMSIGEGAADLVEQKAAIKARVVALQAQFSERKRCPELSAAVESASGQLIEAAQCVVRETGRTFAAEIMGHAVEIQKLMTRWDSFICDMTLTSGADQSRGLPLASCCPDRSGLSQLPRDLRALSEDIDVADSMIGIGGGSV
jgi:hypothetical protein